MPLLDLIANVVEADSLRKLPVVAWYYGRDRMPAERDRGYQAAIRKFPDAEFMIRRLMTNSESFRDMCDELADAEIALASVPETPLEICEARKQEWQELVDRLVGEVAVSLRAGKNEIPGQSAERK